MARFTPRRTCTVVSGLDQAPATRRQLALLANVKVLGEGGAVKRSNFANVIELGSRLLILESSREYDVGDALIISMVFPGMARGSDPVTSLECVVRHVRDDLNMHYDVTIKHMSDAARQRLTEFLSKPDKGQRG